MNYGSFPGTGLESLGSTSSSLLHRAQSHDPDAWRRLVALYGPIVFLWSRQSGLTGHDSADIVQETFAAVAKHLGGFHSGQPGDSFRGWLWTITRNKIRDYARRQKGAPSAQGGTAGQRSLEQIVQTASPPAPRLPAGMLEHRAMEAIRAEFEERSWQAFWQSAVEGRKAAEIAQDLGMTKRAVRQAKYRVLRRMRRELEGLLE